jgi:hypothetical protein
MTASVGRRKLRHQFLDAKPKSGDQQRRGWHWRTLDRNWTLFNLLVRTGDSTGLAASGTTSSSTNLSWSAVPLPAGCSVSYKVRQGGISIATPPRTSDAVTGPTPSTTYGFTVVAPHRSSLFPTRWIHRHRLKLCFLTIPRESQLADHHASHTNNTRKRSVDHDRCLRPRLILYRGTRGRPGPGRSDPDDDHAARHFPSPVLGFHDFLLSELTRAVISLIGRRVIPDSPLCHSVNANILSKFGDGLRAVDLLQRWGRSPYFSLFRCERFCLT